MKCSQCQAEMIHSNAGWLCPSCGHVESSDEPKPTTLESTEVASSGPILTEQPEEAFSNEIAPKPAFPHRNRQKFTLIALIVSGIVLFLLVVASQAAQTLPGQSFGTIILQGIYGNLFYYVPIVAIIILAWILTDPFKKTLPSNAQPINTPGKMRKNFFLLLGLLIIAAGIGAAGFTINTQPGNYWGFGALVVIPFFAIMSPMGWVALVLLLIAAYCRVKGGKPGTDGGAYLKVAQFIGLAFCTALAFLAYYLITSPPPSE